MKAVDITSDIIERYETEITKIKGLEDIYYLISMMVDNVVEKKIESISPKNHQKSLT